MAGRNWWTPLEIANAVLALLFLVSAGLQLNDPDPLRWIAVYALATAACLLRRRLPVVVLLALAVSLGWALWMAPTVLPELELRDIARKMKAETPAIEESRELLGLLIVAGWMVVLLVAGRRGRARTGAPPAPPPPEG